MSVADIDLIITNYRTPDLLRALLLSITEHEPDCSYTVTVIDVDPIVPFERAPKPLHHRGPGRVRPVKVDYEYVLVQENIGYARACNLGAAQTSGRNLVLLNADTRFTNSHCIDRCVEFLDAHDEVAAVGPLQVSSEGLVTWAGTFGTLAKPIHRGFKARKKGGLQDDKQAVTINGSAFFTKRAVWDEMRECHIFKDQFPDAEGAFLLTQHYYEETGYAYHVQGHGYEVWYLGSAEMVHEWHKSSTVGSMSKHVAPSKAIFEEFCDNHGIEYG
jgi:GT2 family glycosyltransferase